MGLFGGSSGGGGGKMPPMSPPPIVMPTPAELPAAPPAPPAIPDELKTAPSPTDADAQKARDEAKKKARAFQGYASTIKTGPMGVTGPASTTAGKQLLGA